MSTRQILRSFQAWRERGEALVLATVYETLGSTYSKAGHRILIAANGDYQGLVSGGCLEGDLAERARRVVETGEPAAVTYDMRDDADELWGLGIGCNGLIRVFLQELTAAGGYEPFASIAARLAGTSRAAAASVVESRRADVPAGATRLLDDVERGADAGTRFRLAGLDADDRLARALDAGCRRALDSGRAELRGDEEGVTVLYSPLEPVPRVLVLGAGLDAIPVVNMAADVGWSVTVADHRPGYIERGGLGRADRVLGIDPTRLGEQLALDEFDAVLVMSHHLETDRAYLAQLAGVGARYLGVLGPRARRERLLEALGAAGDALRPRLHGPVGLDIGADSPETIALSVLAELQTVFAAPGRGGKPRPGRGGGHAD